jgi:alpha-N-arabinofuranosidase
MYKVHRDATLLPLEVKSDTYTVQNETVSAISASASRDQQGLVHLSLVNIDARKAQEISVDIKGKSFTTVTGRILTSADLNAHNTFEKPQAVQPQIFKEATLKNGKLTVKVPPFSVLVLALK